MTIQEQAHLVVYVYFLTGFIIGALCVLAFNRLKAIKDK